MVSFSSRSLVFNSDQDFMGCVGRRFFCRCRWVLQRVWNQGTDIGFISRGGRLRTPLAKAFIGGCLGTLGLPVAMERDGSHCQLSYPYRMHSRCHLGKAQGPVKVVVLDVGRRGHPVT